MAGRIRDEDIAAVRERSSIEELIGEHVQLRNAGGGNLKGICPFHDEKSPSMSVSPSRGLFHCFGCGAGGDVIRFVERIEHLSFADAVEQLAARAGVQLRYAEGGTAPNRPSGQRARLIEAHTFAASFYLDQLATPEARPARDFLVQRGFDTTATAQFGCGYAPSGWESLTKYLLGRGFSGAELTLAGLSKQSSRGTLIDRFHRRLLWPIREVSGEVVGFGARRIHDDDAIEAKYLNTPETPIYKKSQLLYGMDVAKREIAKQHKVVVVEGYTDVMACHLAGVTTAVATCGTAFGGDHISVIRRLLMDSDTFRGEVIFTFDGDAAGMKAAQRAFADEQKFIAQTFVAIESSGKDPCELRQSGGDQAVRGLVDGRIPLVEFMLRTTVNKHDLGTVEGQNAALDEGAPLVAAIKDHARRDDFARKLAGLIGIDEPNRVVALVRGLVRISERSVGRGQPSRTPTSREPAAPLVGVPPRLAHLEREVLKAVLQYPATVGTQFDVLGPIAFQVALHRQLQQAIASAGGATSETAGPAWLDRIAEHLPPDAEARTSLNALAVETLREKPERQPRYAEAMVVSLADKVVAREVAELKSKVQRLFAVGDHDEAGRVHSELVERERQYRQLRERAIGGQQ
jgi:DNA primase